MEDLNLLIVENLVFFFFKKKEKKWLIVFENIGNINLHLPWIQKSKTFVDES